MFRKQLKRTEDLPLKMKMDERDLEGLATRLPSTEIDGNHIHLKLRKEMGNRKYQVFSSTVFLRKKKNANQCRVYDESGNQITVLPLQPQSLLSSYLPASVRNSYFLTEDKKVFSWDGTEENGVAVLTEVTEMFKFQEIGDLAYLSLRDGWVVSTENSSEVTVVLWGLNKSVYFITQKKSGGDFNSIKMSVLLEVSRVDALFDSLIFYREKESRRFMFSVERQRLVGDEILAGDWAPLYAPSVAPSEASFAVSSVGKIVPANEETLEAMYKVYSGKEAQDFSPMLAAWRGFYPFGNLKAKRVLSVEPTISDEEYKCTFIIQTAETAEKWKLSVTRDMLVAVMVESPLSCEEAFIGLKILALQKLERYEKIVLDYWNSEGSLTKINKITRRLEIYE